MPSDSTTAHALRQGGFSLLETLFAVVILTIGLLTHASLTMAEHRLSLVMGMQTRPV